MWSVAVYWLHWLWSPAGSAKSATVCALLGLPHQELQSNLQMAATFGGLGNAQTSQAMKQGRMLLEPGISLLLSGKG